MHHGSRFRHFLLMISESKQPWSTKVNPRFKSNHAIKGNNFHCNKYDGPMAEVPGLTSIYRWFEQGPSLSITQTEEP